MKAIIMERRGAYAAVLCEDGTFVKTRVGGEVGDTVELTAETVAFPKKKKAWARNAIAAVLALAITGGTFGYMDNTASAYVSLDVDDDTAIELTINHFGRVIAVDALDDTAREFAHGLFGEVRRHRAEDALNIAVERLHDGGYLGEDGTAVLFGVTADNDRRAAELREFAERSMERGGGGHTAFVSEMSRDERDRAREQQVSPGRFGFARDHGNQPIPGWGPPPPGVEPLPPGVEPPPPGQEPPAQDGEQPAQTGGI